MPWSDSPRLASGSRMYSLLSSHVRTGDGRSGTAALAAHQAASAIATPQSGSSRLITRFIKRGLLSLEAVDLERPRVRVGVLTIEHAVEERDLGFHRRGCLD